MGNDRRRSVIDRDHRTHDVPNLFLCDGSSFVTSGRGQPTMTIQALAFRAAEKIAKLKAVRSRDLHDRIRFLFFIDSFAQSFAAAETK